MTPLHVAKPLKASQSPRDIAGNPSHLATSRITTQALATQQAPTVFWIVFGSTGTGCRDFRCVRRAWPVLLHGLSATRCVTEARCAVVCGALKPGCLGRQYVPRLESEPSSRPETVTTRAIAPLHVAVLLHTSQCPRDTFPSIRPRFYRQVVILLQTRSYATRDSCMGKYVWTTLVTNIRWLRANPSG